MSEHDTTLRGSWRLVSFETELQDSKERIRPWGDDPNGFVVFDAGGRMMVLVTAQARAPGSTDEHQLALFRTLMAYTGRVRVEADRFVTTIDASWNQAWNGSEQARFYRIEGDTLEVSTAWMPNPLMAGNPLGRGILIFRRESPSDDLSAFVSCERQARCDIYRA